MEDVKGKTALITGGAGGIGRGMALAFARAGISVVMLDIEKEGMRNVAEEVRALGVEAIEEIVDLANASAVEACAASVRQRIGQPDILCANAGVMVRKNLLDSKSDDWQWLFGVNVFGLVNTLRAFLPGMIEGGGERHVMITASMAALRGSSVAGSTLYSSSKAAVMSIGEALRRELPPNVALTLLCPGGVATGLWNAERYRPDQQGNASSPASEQRKQLGLGNDVMDPMEVGRLTVAALRDKRPYIMTHPHQWRDVEPWHRGIENAFREAAR